MEYLWTTANCEYYFTPGKLERSLAGREIQSRNSERSASLSVSLLYLSVFYICQSFISVSLLYLSVFYICQSFIYVSLLYELYLPVCYICQFFISASQPPCLFNCV